MLCCLIQGQTLLESDVWMINTIINRNRYAMDFMSWSFITTCHQYQYKDFSECVCLSVCLCVTNGSQVLGRPDLGSEMHDLRSYLTLTLSMKSHKAVGASE